VNKIIDVERFFTERVMINHILCFFSVKEISKTIGCSYEHTRRTLKEMETNGIVVKHPCSNSFRISREHFTKHYEIEKEIKND
jgi:DNA-binding transcriptional regulator YhcF (GntR family)